MNSSIGYRLHNLPSFSGYDRWGYLTPYIGNHLQYYDDILMNNPDLYVYQIEIRVIGSNVLILGFLFNMSFSFVQINAILIFLNCTNVYT